ncbi:MAG: hypothetical protein CMO81_09975 [Waddliaceae bacterium]|nr:hypothetical protein [Waddliaceae bacterium]|tara:strand:+ start:338 stop:727 length:390 start_codon:yes stop_codon:yes gene_type:complete
MHHTVALFGEAERGDFRTAYFCESLPQLVDTLGHPPEDSMGLYYAVQALMYQRNLIFFRVPEEGYSRQDYLLGLRFLQNRDLIPKLSAICLPGVGDTEIIEATTPVCDIYNSLLILGENDLYDLLTDNR